MSKVHFLECRKYEDVKSCLLPVLKEYEKVFRPESTVLIKPNLLSAKKKEEAVTTHPEVIRVIVEFLKDINVNPIIGDSPPIDSADKVLQKSGIKDICGRYNVPIADFNESIEVNGEIYKKIKIAKIALEVDYIINVPKLKTHSQMMMTFAVKNLFGCVPGLEKPLWHLRAGNPDNLANVLIDICLIVKPTLNILDGVYGMEGNGPVNGTVKRFGVIVVSDNAFALDHALVKALNVDPETVFTVKHSLKRGLVPEYEVIGEYSNTIKLPQTISSIIPGPNVLHSVARRFVYVPTFNKNRCIQCGRCEKACPANAINVSEYKIDYQKCIRCYVCDEVCPTGAINLKRKFIL